MSSAKDSSRELRSQLNRSGAARGADSQHTHSVVALSRCLKQVPEIQTEREEGRWRLVVVGRGAAVQQPEPTRIVQYC